MEAEMTHFVGLDASKKMTSVCVMDGDGNVVKETTLETDPAVIVAYLRGERRRYRRIGLESTGFAPWLYEGLAKAGLPMHRGPPCARRAEGPAQQDRSQ